MLLEKCSKRGDLMTSQNSENGVPVHAGVQLTVIREDNFLDLRIVWFGGLLCAVLRPNVATNRAKENLERVQKSALQTG